VGSEETERSRIGIARRDAAASPGPVAVGDRRRFVFLPRSRAALGLRLADVADRVADAARRDLDGGLALPGLVVVFACGIALYFALPREPWPPAVAVLAVVAVGVTWARRRRGHAARLAATLTALVLGAAAASFETARVAAPRLDHERTVTVEGRVVDLDATASGGLRLTVDVARMEGRGLTRETTPTRISATLTAKGARPDVGDAVRFKARLKPPEGPVMPGGYDFARRAWFEGRGAGGYILGRVTPIDLGPADWSDRLFRPIGSLRHAIAERVRASLPGATGAIGAALMVGEQRAIPEAAAEPLRASGLTHIVSISGLHMGLVAGGVIVAIRALLALFPALALGYPIKKWAAAVAFVAATIYLLLSGNQVAALRSHLMLSVALLAVLVDRPAITMHTVAVAAILIMAVTPSAAMEPSFQMSFLAVIALVASYDLYRSWTARRPPPRRDAGLVAHLVGGTLRNIEGFAFSSLVAGLATAPVIAGTFFRAAPYSILANMAVLPVTGIVIMPAAVVSALAMPFGLDHWPLQVMGLGIDWMILVGQWAAALPAGDGLIGAPHPAMMPLGIAAVLGLSAWKSRIRLFGLIPAVAACVLLFLGPRPDVLIGRHGSPVAVRGDDGRLHVLAGRQDRFDTAIWLAADRDARSAQAAGLGEGWLCDPAGCVFRALGAEVPVAGTSVLTGAGARADLDLPGGAKPRDGLGASGGDGFRAVDAGRIGGDVSSGTAIRDGVDDPAGASAPGRSDASLRDGGSSATSHRPVGPVLEIAVVRHPSAFDEDCRRAALVITTLVAPPGCRDLTAVVDRLDLARGGASTLDFTGPPRPIGSPSSARNSVERSRSETGADDGRAPADPTRDPETAPGGDRGAAARDGDGGEIDSIEPASSYRETPRSDPSSTRTGVASGGIANRPGVEPPATEPRAAEPRDAAGPDEVHLRRDGRVRTSLPASPRPWTPLDPRIAELEREAEEIDAEVRAAQ
jgi:competence protein ComEC